MSCLRDFFRLNEIHANGQLAWSRHTLPSAPTADNRLLIFSIRILEEMTIMTTFSSDFLPLHEISGVTVSHYPWKA